MTERIRPQCYGPERETLTVSEAAKLIGINRDACYEACRQGRIPHLRFGRRIVIPRAALLRWMDEEAAHSVSTHPPQDAR